MILFSLQLLINFILGFIINYLIFKFVLMGIFGVSIKNYFFSEKIEITYAWQRHGFNKFLLFYFVICFSLMFINSNNIIYLDNDTAVNFSMDNFSINVTGEILYKILSVGGASAAFVIGSKLGYASALKANYGLLGKTGISVASGVSSSLSWKLYLTAEKYLEGMASPCIVEKTDNGSINVELKNVTINTNTTVQGVSPLEQVPANLSNIKSLFNNNPIKFNDNLVLKLNTKLENNSKIIEMIERQTNSSHSSAMDIFKLNNKDINIIINSPLESSELSSRVIQNQAIELLNYNLALHYIMIYLIIMSLFIFTVKFLIENNIRLDNIKNLPLGKYIFFILNKIISLWKKSNTFWIYFILFVLLISTTSATYGLYVSLILVEHI